MSTFIEISCTQLQQLSSECSNVQCSNLLQCRSVHHFRQLCEEMPLFHLLILQLTLAEKASDQLAYKLVRGGKYTTTVPSIAEQA